MVAVTGIERLRGYARRMDELHVWPGGARLLGIADQIEHEHAEDCFRMGERAAEDAEAAAWVREHGGLSHVKDILHDFRAAVERIGVEWSESELHGLMDALDRRLMPEGCEWPRYEDGEPVRIGDEYVGEKGETQVVRSVRIVKNGSEIWNWEGGYDWIKHGKRVRRPAVLAADGEPLEVGQAVHGIGHCQHEFRVLQLNDPRPETDGRFSVRCFDMDEGEECWCEPRFLTHVNPEPSDSWERVEEDAMVDAKDYCESRGIRPEYPKHSGKAKCEDLVRRCKELAEKGE